MTMAFPQASDSDVLNTNRDQENAVEGRDGGGTDDTVDNDEKDKSFNRFVAVNRDCCVRTVLISVVVTTAIVLIVILVSHKKTEKTEQTIAAQTESVHWLGNKAQKQLVFEHQFLLRHLGNQHSLQILAIDSERRKYVIMWPDINRHFNLYMVVNFEKSMETVLIVSKSENEYATDVEEKTILLCETKRFNRDFQGQLAAVADIVAISNVETKSTHSNVAYAVSYIGGPLALGPFISTVVNSSCEDLPKIGVFKWDKLDESLACGDRVYSETDLESCSQDLCQSFPGIPLSRGQICQKFRTCNYIQRSCDPYYLKNPSKMENKPYCNCRNTAAKDAEGISCPRVADDGGECEIPRRDLLVTQRSLPCLCMYRFPVVYPYTSVRTTDSQSEKVKDGNVLKWYMKEEAVTGPALTCSQCPC